MTTCETRVLTIDGEEGCAPEMNVPGSNFGGRISGYNIGSTLDVGKGQGKKLGYGCRGKACAVVMGQFNCSPKPSDGNKSGLCSKKFMLDRSAKGFP